MPVNFSRGIPEMTPTQSARFEANLLPLQQKEELCRSLLAEFGVVNIRERSKDHELIHACLVDPTHQNQDREPTASLNYQNLGYRCLGCGAKGYLPWLIAVVRGGTTEDARRWLNQETGLGGNVMDVSLLMKYLDSLYLPKVGLAPLVRFPETMLRPWALLHPYLTDPKPYGREIREENVLQMRLGYAEHYKIGERADGTDITSERIVIPHFWKGDLVGWQTRRLNSRDGTAKYLSSPDFPKDQTIYNYEARHTGPVVVMEAMLSVVSKVHLERWHCEGTFGASMAEEQIRLLSKHPRIILFMDNDKAGWEAVEGTKTFSRDGRLLSSHPGLGETLGRSSNVFVVENPWAADPQDISDEDFDSLCDQAVPYSIWRRPTTLLCYSCNEVAHDGPC